MKLRSVWKSNRGHLTVWNHLTRTTRVIVLQEPDSGGFQFRVGVDEGGRTGQRLWAHVTADYSHPVQFNKLYWHESVQKKKKKNAAEASKCNLSRKKTVWTVSLTSLSHQNFSLHARRSLRPPVLILIEFNFILQIRWPRSNSSHKHQHQCVLTYVCVCVWFSLCNMAPSRKGILILWHLTSLNNSWTRSETQQLCPPSLREK